jgi:hypothetical protein
MVGGNVVGRRLVRSQPKLGISRLSQSDPLYFLKSLYIMPSDMIEYKHHLAHFNQLEPAIQQRRQDTDITGERQP